jgi:periplasmic protein TonB
MSLALSPRRTDRHPVGLLIVIGLHVLLAAALVSARLARPPSEPPPVALTPLDPVQPVKPKPLPLPDPAKPQIRLPLVVELPVVQADPPPQAIAAQVDDHADKPEIVASVTPRGDGIVHPGARVPARAARIDAGATQCRPEYPAAAQRVGATGVTRIRFSVDATGRVAGSRIVQSSGPSREHRLLDRAAAEALAQCPVQVGTDETGHPVGTTTDVDYVWTLN